MSENSIRLNEDSVFRIIIATDTHLGYLENDEIRGNDSFNSFEEILKISKAEMQISFFLEEICFIIIILQKKQ